LAALSPANDDVAQRKAGAWTNRTPAQLKADLAFMSADLGDATGTGLSLITAIPSIADLLSYNVKLFGAKGDADATQTASINSGSTQLALTSGAFTGADQGKRVVVPGAGSARTFTDGAINVSTNTKQLTSPTGAAFTSGDARSTIVIPGAGPSGATLITKINSVIDSHTITLEDAAATTVSGASVTVAGHLMTTISSVASGVATLAATAGRTVTGATFLYGTDDITPCTNAMNAAKALGRGTVYFPAGTYLLSSEISLDNADRIHIMGAGKGATTIYRVGTGGTAIFHTTMYTASPNTPLTDFTLTNMTLDGFYVQSAAYSVHNCGVRANGNLSRCTFTNLYVRHTLATGLGLDGMQNGCVVAFNNLYKCGSGDRGGVLTPGNGGSAGIGIGCGGGYVNDFTVIGNQADSCGTYGVFCETVNPTSGVRGPKIIGNTMCNNYLSGFADNGVYGAIVEGNYSYSNKQDGFQTSGATIANNAPVDGGSPGNDTQYVGNTAFGNVRHGFSYEPWLIGQSTQSETDASLCRIAYKSNKSYLNLGRGWDIQAGSTGTLDHMDLADNDAYQNGLSGFGFGGAGAIKNATILGGSSFNNGTQNATGDKYGYRFTTITLTDLVIRNVKAYDNNGTPHQSHGISFASTCNITGITVVGNELRNNVTAAIDNSWASLAGNKVFRDNAGVAPGTRFGSAFSLGTSGNAATNNTGGDITLYVTAAGTVTAVSVNGVSTGFTSLTVGQAFRVPAMGTFTISYSAAPTVVAVND
jgi:hypothetical protein